eukprot:gene1616-2850_t
MEAGAATASSGPAPAFAAGPAMDVGPQVSALSFSRDGSLLAATYLDGQ